MQWELLRGSLCKIHPVIFPSKIDFANFPPKSLVLYATHKTETFLSKLFLCSPKSTRTTLAHCWPFGRLLKSENQASLVNRSSITIDALAFKFVLLRSLVPLLFIKMFKTASHLISTECQSMWQTYLRLCFTMANFEIIKKWENIFRSSPQQFKVQGFIYKYL